MRPANFTSLLFALALLIYVTPFQAGQEKLPEKRISEKIQETSVAAVNFAPSLPRSGAVSPPGAAAFRSEPEASSIKKISDILEPQVNVRAAAVMDLDSGEIFFEKNSDRNYSLASLTKLMTAVIVVEKIGENTIMSFQGGGHYFSGDLLRAMLVASNNEIAENFAQFYGYEKFISEMNEKAHVLGMKQTHYFDASGLNSQNQSSVSDLFKLVDYTFKNHPQIFEITRQTSASIVNRDTNVLRQFYPTNRFAGRPDFLGGKTGFGGDPGLANLISIFYYNDNRVAIFILGALDQESRFTETEKLLDWFKKSFAWL